MVVAQRWEAADGREIAPVAGYDVAGDARLVLVVKRRCAARCAKCLRIGAHVHVQLPVRRWQDLPAIGHPVVIEYAAVRLKCRCGTRAVELLSWADPYQRQTKRLQQQPALDAFSMPLSHVATKYGRGAIDPRCGRRSGRLLRCGCDHQVRRAARLCDAWLARREQQR